MSLNLIDQAAQRKRIEDLLANPIQSAAKIESLDHQLATVTAQRDLFKECLTRIATSRVGQVDSIAQELFDREMWASEALASLKGE